MLERHGRVQTPKAQYYLNLLCKHFSHKIPAQWDEQYGQLDFEIGQCLLRVEDDNLLVHCVAEDTEDLHELMDTIKRHFDRFAHKEACELAWLP